MVKLFVHLRGFGHLWLNNLYSNEVAQPPQPQLLSGTCYQQVLFYILPFLLSEWGFALHAASLHFSFKF